MTMKHVPDFAELHITTKLLKEKIGIYKIRIVIILENNTPKLKYYELLGIDNKQVTSFPNQRDAIINITSIDEILNRPSILKLLYIIHINKEITIRQLSIKSELSYPAVYNYTSILQFFDYINIVVDTKDKLKSKVCSINNDLLEILIS